MVGEEKRHQVMQNLYNDRSEEEEGEGEVDSEHESNRQPDYAYDKGDDGLDAEPEGEGEGKPLSSLSSSSSAARLWKPAAQRNLRNQWSKLNLLYQDWHSAASAGRTHTTAIVNSYLS